MKKFFLFIGFILISAGLVYAGSSGGTAPAVGKVYVPLTVPKASKSACATMAAGRATQVSLDVSATTMINWEAKTADTATTAGTATVVKRKLGTTSAINSAYINKSSETNLPIETGVSRVVLERYSSATPLTICSEMN